MVWAPATPSSVGSSTIRTRVARDMKGRTGAAKGWGASTRTALKPERLAASVSTVSTSSANAAS